MATSGSEKTQVGRHLSGVGKKQSFSPKAPGVGVTFKVAWARNRNVLIQCGGVK